MGTEENKIVRYLFEAGELKREKRTGWWHAGVKDPESVAEHSMRTAVIALLLAEKRKMPNPERLAAAALLHDLHEARLGDRHKIAARYDAGERRRQVERVTEEQCSVLPAGLKKYVQGILELNQGEHAVVRDADLLENALQAREYYDIGFKESWRWIERIELALVTPEAKALLKELKKTSSFGWWHDLKLPVQKKT